MTNQVFVPTKRGDPCGSRFTSALCLLGTMMLAGSVSSALAQRVSSQFEDQASSAQWIISKNQLITPKKAIRATDQAHDELLHGDVDAAQKQIAHALEIAPHCALALNIQGVIDVKMHHLAEAVSSFQKAIDNDPSLGSAYLGLGVVFVGQGRFKDALIPLDRARDLLPSTWTVFFESGMAHLELGHTDEALEQARLADRITETDLEGKSAISFLRALIQLKLHDIPRARTYFIQAINYDPNGTYVPLARRALETLQPVVASNK